MSVVGGCAMSKVSAIRTASFLMLHLALLSISDLLPEQFKPVARVIQIWCFVDRDLCGTKNPLFLPRSRFQISQVSTISGMCSFLITSA
jgi:hypothetical protein